MLIAGLIAVWGHTACFENQWIRFIWYLLAYFPVGLPVLKEAWESIREKDIFSEYLLMSIATIGAFFIGEYPEGVAVMLFYAIGEHFQDAAIDRAKKNIGDLLDVRPETANLVKGDTLETVSPEAVKTGEIIEIKTGGRIPLDGLLLNDSATFNTAALTGESLPRTIEKGEEVLAGMIVADQVIRIQVVRPFGQSALSRILELVENASVRKAPAEQFIRRFARIYTPAVVALAVLIVLLPWIYALFSASFSYDFNTWLYKGLVFLVISCPCALVISIPLGYFGGIGAASRHGVLFKGSNYLDAITQVNTMVFDKTGTLTKGVFEVQEIVADGAISENNLLKIIASTEAQSTHPIAKAIVEYANQQKIILEKPENTKEIAGLGLEAALNGSQICVGNTKLLDSYHIIFPEEIRLIPETTVLCAIDSVYAGYITVADTLKEDVSQTLVSLRRLGIKNLVMLSGDKQAIVSKLASELGIEQAYGDLLPENKVEHIEHLKSNPANIVAFVGDGINDAPVLALSDVGIAMGGLGSDVAIEAADLIIQTDQPGKIVTAIQLGKITRRIVIQNISLALGVKIIVLILATAGIATLWEAVFADVGVALLAILNAIRILKIKINRK
ncbi:cadmium/zinc/cobalt-transporting ATPase [Bacteroidia bacterium]|nr:cadmium/zinc/cobalt-transporting ATPase [Bacteroidia bacterium]